MSVKEMDYQLHGFMIGKEIHFDIDNGRIYRLPANSTERSFIFGSIFFNATMLKLFIYLLLHARHKKVTKDELLKNVWEENNLIPSTQRLWQVLNNLNKKLRLLGLPGDFILNMKGSGYIINYLDVTPIYYRISDLSLTSGKEKE
ncbi:winged helix-turn-helix domain-containing protein [Buttiauxella sp.]|uniref:winged helix-turn-helix domain-containing protein n=1 Tax=Buttiauxella sp. TaxID=1972222 RepID=UPI003C73E513